MRILVPALALALLAPCLEAAAQRRPPAPPRRPALPAAADTNDARAYYELGAAAIDRRPAEAAAAFYWAIELEPRSAEALYARHAALMLAEPIRVLEYHGYTRRVRDSQEIARIDSLYYRALMLDPFVQRRFERTVLRTLIAGLIVGGDPSEVQNQSLLHYYTSSTMQQLAPLTRARLHAAEGRLPDAMREYDAALREARRAGQPRESRRWIHHERGRVLALAGNPPQALVEFAAAIEATEERERDVLVRVYSSKAMIEHSRGLLHERRGDHAGAREAYSRALMEDLSYYPAHARLAQVALALGDTATALDELALTVQIAPDDPVARLVYGNLLVDRAMWAEAEGELLEATRLATRHAEPWILLGDARQRQGKPAEALEAYRGFLARARRADPRRARIEAIVAAGGG
jgi:tetratricopeptide (TPR) repeat protein